MRRARNSERKVRYLRSASRRQRGKLALRRNLFNGLQFSRLMTQRGILTVFCLTAVGPSIGCIQSRRVPPPMDRSFCAIAEQAGKATPSLAQVESLTGRYEVTLYSADSG